MCKAQGFALATVVATRQPSSKKLQLQNFLHNQLFLYCSQGGGAEHRTGCISLVKSRALVMNLSAHCWNLHQQIGQTVLFPRCKVIHMDFFLMLYSHSHVSHLAILFYPSSSICVHKFCSVEGTGLNFTAVSLEITFLVGDV